MANKFFTILTLLLAWIILTEKLSATTPEKISMTVGENRSIHVENAIRLHVSRKGVIHLVHDHDDYWSITAIKTGVVAIEVKLRQKDPRIIYVDVRPRLDAGKKTRLVTNNSPQRHCIDGIQPVHQPAQYEVHTTVELVDGTDVQTSGSDGELSWSLNPSMAKATIGLKSSPQKASYKRRIIGDPIVTAQACDDLEIKAGGEDEFETKTDQGHIVSAWKTHGLMINMKLIPISQHKIRIPFEVTLKSPSRDRGAYGLSEVSSSIDVPFGTKTLAAAINMASSSSSEKEPLFLSKVPIIGPLFRSNSDSQSASKLLVWLTVKALP